MRNLQEIYDVTKVILIITLFCLLEDDKRINFEDATKNETRRAMFEEIEATKKNDT